MAAEGKTMGTRWIERKIYEVVLNEFHEKRKIMNAIIKRKIKLIRHRLRHNRFITIIMKTKVNGKRTRESLRKSFFEEIFQRMGFTSYKPLERIASD